MHVEEPLEPLTEEEIEFRRPVWKAFSEFFLDTSLDASDVQRISKTLASSPYSPKELDRILQWEVYPACRGNLFWIAGEWSGFDPEWLERRILRGPSPLMKAWAATLGRVSISTSITWHRIQRRIREYRAR